MKQKTCCVTKLQEFKDSVQICVGLRVGIKKKKLVSL